MADVAMGWLETFGLVTGIVMVFLEIFHSRWMWFFEIASCVAFLLIYLPMCLWGNAAMQVYYIVMSFVGLIAWARDKKNGHEDAEIVLNRLTGRTLWISAAAAAIGSPLCILLFKATGDARPVLDGMVTMLSLLGTWWLAKSFIEQWFIWIVADALNVLLFFLQKTDGVDSSMGPLLMSIAFLASAAVGYFFWKRNGKYKTGIS